MSTAKKRNAYLLIIAAFFLAFAAGRVRVRAAAAPANVKQTEADSSGIKFSFDTVLQKNIKYYYRISDTDEFAADRTIIDRIGSGSQGKGTIRNNLKAGSSYYLQVGTSFSAGTSVPEDISWSETAEVVTAPETLKEISQTNASASSVTLEWEAVDGANCYGVSCYPVGGKEKDAADILAETNKAVVRDLQTDTAYNVSIRAGRRSASGFIAYSAGKKSSHNVKTLPGKVAGLENTSFGTNNKSARIEWEKTEVAEQYEYIVSDNKGKKIRTDTVSAWYVNVEKLSDNRFYLVKVRGCITLSGNRKKTGAWSDPLYFAASPGKESLRAENAGNAIEVSWGKVAGATGYTVYISEKRNSDYRKASTVNAAKRNLKIKKFNKKKLVKGKTYYIRVVAVKQTKSGGVFTSSDNPAYCAWLRKE